MMTGILIIFVSTFAHTFALRIDPPSSAKSGYALQAQRIMEQLQHDQTPVVFSKTSEMTNLGTYTKSLKILLSNMIKGPAGGFPQVIEDEINSFVNEPNDATSKEWPRIIHQTAKSEADLHPVFKAGRHSWQHNHPDWEYKFWNDTDMTDFMKSHYPNFMETWDLYPRQIMRIDAVRYFWMHHYGGIYADMDYFALRNWESFFTKEAESQVIVPKLNEHSVGNALLMSKPQHPFWKVVHEYLPYRLHKALFQVEAESSKLHQEAEALIDRYFGSLEPEIVTGPIFLQGLVDTLGGDRLKDLKAKLPSGSLFYPIDWTKGEESEHGIKIPSWNEEHKKEIATPDLLEDALRKSFPDSLGATVWTHTWGDI